MAQSPISLPEALSAMAYCTHLARFAEALACIAVDKGFRFSQGHHVEVSGIL